MNRFTSLIILFLFCTILNVSAQLVVNSTATNTQLVNNLAGQGVTITNFVRNCPTGGSGTFNGANSNVGISSGVILTTGSVNNAVGPNGSGSSGTNNNTTFADPNLTTLSSGAIYDPCIIEFDITPTCSTLAMTYVFGSEEYPEFVNSINDAFGFFISGPGITGTQNIALIPNTTTGVSINTVNPTANSIYYFNNAGGTSVQYDGFTVPLTASVNVIPGQTYHMKLAIADASDHIYDSGVFLTYQGLFCPQPLVVSPPVTVCPGQSTVLTASGASSYSWSPATGLNTTTGSSVVASPSSTTTYTVTGTTGSQTQTGTIIVTVVNLTPPSLSVINATCVCDGSITSGTPGNGTAPFAYSWSNGSTGATAFSLCPGSYTVTVTDGNGCTANATGNVGTTPGPVLSTSSVAASCFGGSDGSATVIGQSGTRPYTYSWSGLTSTDSVATGLSAGSYSVTLTDANGCTSTTTIGVGQPGTPVGATIITQDVSCRGAMNGSASVQGTGGTPGYNYLWSTGLVNDSISNLAAGTYSVSVIDANGCQYSSPVIISEPANGIDITHTVTNVNCFGDSTGAVSIQASGGTPSVLTGYTYSWSSGQDSSSIIGVPAGMYVVTVTDSLFCLTRDTSYVTEPALLVVTPTVTDANCYGSLDGGISLSVSGGTPGFLGYTYSWSTGLAQGNVLTGAPAGLYTYAVTDSLGCSDTLSSVINQPLPLISNTSSSATSCNGAPDGAATVTVSGGVSPYSYSWSSGATTANAFNLSGGMQYVTITDAHNCTHLDSVEVIQLPPLVVNINKKSPGCNGSLGWITANASGGSGTYSYSWSNGQQTDSIGGLSAGTYTVTVTSQNTFNPWQIYKEDFQGPLNWTLNVPIGSGSQGNEWRFDDVSAGGAAGSCMTTGSGDSTLYVGIAGNALSGATYNDSVSSNIAAVSPGISTAGYNNIRASFDYMSWGEPLEDYAAFDISVDNGLSWINMSPELRSDTCAQGVGEWSSVSYLLPASASNITDLRLRFVWVNNNDSNAFNPSVAINNITLFSDRTSGSCSATQSVTLNNATPPVISSSSATPALCNTASGTATVTPSQGTGPYSYSWNTTPGQSTQTAVNLGQGIYTVLVTDANGCTVNGAVTVPQQNQNLDVSFTIVAERCTVAGSASAIISNGTAPYQYSWNTSPVQNTQTAINLGAGLYNVTVTDANGCSGQGTAQVPHTSQGATVSLTVTDAICLSSNGAVAATASGASSYTYSWDTQPSQSGSSIQGLAPGVYNVTVTDNFGCTTVASAEVKIQNQAFVVSIDSVATRCGMNEGQAVAQALGGTPGYTYSWSNGQSGPTATGLNAGEVMVHVTDQNGCYSDTSINVPSFDYAVSFTATPMSGFAPLTVSVTNTSEATTSMQGMNIAYSWTFGNGTTATGFTPSPVTYTEGGDFQIILTGDNGRGCVDTAMVTIHVDDQLSLVIPNIFTPNGDGDNDEFRLTGKGLAELNVVIFNRWGRKVAELMDITQSWSGDDHEAGVYFYIVTYKGKDNVEQQPVKGHVTLRR
jgi:gliding motility-associated-like protein